MAALVYLDAAYGWAFYDEPVGDFDVDMNALQKALNQLRGTGYSGKAMQELLATSLPNFERDLREEQKNQAALPPAVLASWYVPITGSMAKVLPETQKYARIGAPALAIFGLPHTAYGPPMDAARRAVYEARDEETTGAQANAFEKGVPGARVVRLAHARHEVFQSNEADVLKEIGAFIAALPQ